MANAVETRTQNILAVIKAIHTTPGISKPQLCKTCGITASTVQNIVERLLEKNAVVSSGILNSTGGRKAVRYTINPNYKLILAVSIRLSCIEISLFNMKIEEVHHIEKTVSLNNTGPENYVANLIKDIKALIKDTNTDISSIAGIGIGVPGPTNFETGVVKELSGVPLWCDFPLGSRIFSSLKIPVWVDKDAYSSIQYLDYSGQIKKGQTTVYITIYEGISAALMINGKVFRGSNSLAGEIGHVTVRRDGARCHCGNIGCLELYCSDIGIVSQYSLQSEKKLHSIDEVIQLAEDGNEIAQQVFVQAVKYLVETTSNVIMNYDPNEIVIFCRWLHKQESLYFNMLDSLYAKSVFTQRHTANIRLLPPSPIYLDSVAAMVGAQYFFSKNSPFIQKFDE